MRSLHTNDNRKATCGYSSLVPKSNISNPAQLSSSSGANRPNTAYVVPNADHHPKSIKIKRDDLSPVSKFREEQKGYLLNLNSPSSYSTSSPSTTYRVPNRHDHSISVYSPSSFYSVESNQQSRTRQSPPSTNSYKSSYDSGKTAGSNYRPNSSIHSIVSIPSNKVGFSSYSPTTITPTSTKQSASSSSSLSSAQKSRLSHYRVQYSDSEDDKIC